jgi:hypothetical protein
VQSFTGSTQSTWAGAVYPDYLALPSGASSLIWEMLTYSYDATHHSTRHAILTFYASDHATSLGSTSAEFLYAQPTYGAGGGVAWLTGVTTGQSVPNTLAAIAALGMTATIPTGAAYVSIAYTETLGTASSDISQSAITVYCGGSSADSPNCCPDLSPVITGITQLQATLAALLVSQPSLGATSYASGAVHAGLSAAGALSFTDAAIGVKVNLTTLGPTTGAIYGDPIYYPNAGFINLLTEQGPLAGIRVEYDGQFVPFPSLIASLTYSFPVGTVATITEITAGP